jgi:hypothetical protein
LFPACQGLRVEEDRVTAKARCLLEQASSQGVNTAIRGCDRDERDDGVGLGRFLREQLHGVRKSLRARDFVEAHYVGTNAAGREETEEENSRIWTRHVYGTVGLAAV